MAHRRRDGDRRSVEVDDDLSPTDHRVVMMAREALGSTIERFAPRGSSKAGLAATTIVGLFVDVIDTLASAPELAEAVNRRLEHSGYRLTTIDLC